MNLFRLWRDYRAQLVASLLLEALMRMLMFAIVEPDVAGGKQVLRDAKDDNPKRGDHSLKHYGRKS